MPEVLLYQTSDPRFADHIVETLEHADISCYHTGTGYADLHPGLNMDLAGGVCVYIRHGQDYQRANELLVELGAAVEQPVSLSSLRAILVLAAVVALLAAIAAMEWK